MIELVLPWSDGVLSPNASKRHWRSKHDAKVAARETGFTLALPHRETHGLCGNLHLTITFHPPDRRHRDLDNWYSALKSVQDGICQALEIDDEQFRRVTLAWGEVVKGGEVVLRLEAIE